jgi:hypothetical protein
MKMKAGTAEELAWLLPSQAAARHRDTIRYCPRLYIILVAQL